VVLLVYTHYFGLFLLCGHATVVVWQLIRRLRSGRRADSLRLASAASLTAVVCAFALAPLVPTFLQQRAQVQGGFWRPPLTATRLASTAHEVVARPFSQEPAPTSELILASVAVLLVPFSLALRPSHRDVVVLLLLLVPPVAGAAVSMLDVPVWNARYLSGTVALWSVAAGGATLRISDDLVRRGIQCAVLALCAMSALDFVDYLTDEAQNGPRTAAKLLDARRNAQEPVFCTSPFVYVPTIYCAQHSENWKLVALADYPHFVGTAVLTPEMYCDRACVTRVASSAERVWTVGTFEPRPHWLAQEWVVETEQRIKDRHRTILVRSFRKRGGR